MSFNLCRPWLFLAYSNSTIWCGDGSEDYGPRGAVTNI